MTLAISRTGCSMAAGAEEEAEGDDEGEGEDEYEYEYEYGVGDGDEDDGARGEKRHPAMAAQLHMLTSQRGGLRAAPSRAALRQG